MRIRLAISLVLVALVSILSVVAFAQYSTAREINTYMFRGGVAGLNFLVGSLEEYYHANGTWDGVDIVFAGRYSEEHMPGMPEQGGPGSGRGMMQQRLLMAAESGVILVDTEEIRIGGFLTEEEQTVAIQLKDNRGNLIGYLFGVDGMQFQPGADRDLLEKLNTAAFNAALLAGGVAVILGILLGYFFLRPVKQLTLAANQIASGDLSHRVAAQGKDELATLGQAFNTMAESLENARETRQAMTADIAHELRTPLAIQRAILEAMQDGVYPLDPEQIKLVYEQNQSLTRLVDDLRTLALADSGELKLERVETNIHDLVGRVLSRFKPQADQKNIQLELINDDELENGLVLIDPFRIDQVLNNLVSNAIRYSPAGSTVTAVIVKQKGQIAISVRDQGEGIPENELANIFERFYRTNHSRSRDDGGTGLGLAIARQLARAHDGDLTVCNTPNGGAEFGLTLPEIKP